MRPAALSGLAFLLSATSIRAEDATRTFSIESSSARECPDVSSFAWRVSARTPRAKRAEAGSAEIAFRLSVDVAGDGATGTLEILSASSSSARHVRGASCAEVVDALALVAALVLDPNASTEPLSAPPPAARDAGPTPPVEAPTPPTAAPVAPAVTTTTPPPAPPIPAPTRSSSRWRFGGGVRAFATDGIAPDPVVGLGVSLALLQDTRASVVEPLVLLHLSTARSSVVETELGDARFSWIGAELSGCPLRLPADGPFAMRPCAGFELGQLTGEGSNIDEPGEETATWAALTAGLDFELWAADVLRIALGAGGFLSLARDEFFLEEGSGAARRRATAHTIPAMGARAAVGLALLFP